MKAINSVITFTRPTNIVGSYQMHVALNRAFPQRESNVSRRIATDNFLFVENGDRVMVRSQIKPMWDRLRPRLQFEVTDHDCKLEYAPGTVLCFSLKANPTIQKRVQGKKHCQRIGITDPEEQCAWLQRKAEQGGFNVIMDALQFNHSFSTEWKKIQVNQFKKDNGRWRRKYRSEIEADKPKCDLITEIGPEWVTAAAAIEEKPMTHLYASYNGLIEVTDQEKFRETLIHGVAGSAKGFGCGLLLVRTVKI